MWFKASQLKLFNTCFSQETETKLEAQIKRHIIICLRSPVLPSAEELREAYLHATMNLLQRTCRVISTAMRNFITQWRRCCVYVYIYIYMCYLCIDVYIYTYVYILLYIYIYIYIYTYIHTSTCSCPCPCPSLCAWHCLEERLGLAVCRLSGRLFGRLSQIDMRDSLGLPRAASGCVRLLRAVRWWVR